MDDRIVEFCSDLLAEVGEELVLNFHSRNMTDMFRRFKEVNSSAST